MAGSGDVTAARRYAGALFNLTRDKNDLQNVAAGLNAVAQAARETPDLMTVLHHPRISDARKKEVLNQVFGGQVPGDVSHLLLMMVEKDRADIIPGVAQQFARLMDEHLRETDAEAVTAIPLTPAQETAIVEKLQASTGQRVRLKTRVDENILGGLVLRVGDKLIDASVASQLSRMRDNLKQVKVT